MPTAPILLSVFLVLGYPPAAAQPQARLAIEVLQGVRLEPLVFGRPGEKGRLDYYRATTSGAVALELEPGERFAMVAELGEGGCRIEYQGDTFDLQSCYWLPGFLKRQDDVYRVVAE